MKKLWILLLLVLLLWGCAGEEATFETVADDMILPAMAQPRQFVLQLPDDAVTPVLNLDQEQVYLCADYEIVVETLSSGDIGATLRHISGYDPGRLTVLQTQQDDVTRYEFVWVCAGESGDRLGRAVILDDGAYHYCLSVVRDEASETGSQIVWSEVFDSFRLV